MDNDKKSVIIVPDRRGPNMWLLDEIPRLLVGIAVLFTGVGIGCLLLSISYRIVWK